MKKLAEFTGLDGLDVLVAITPATRNLARCESLIAAFRDVANMDHDANSFSADVLEKLIPALFLDARNDLLQIVSVINGVSVDDISSLSAMQIFSEVAELLNDSDFVGFFRSFVAADPKK